MIRLAAAEGARRLAVGIHTPAPGEVRSAARRIGCGIQADHRRADRRGHVRWTGVGTEQHAGAREQREELGECVLADLIDEWHAAGLLDGFRHPTLALARAAGKYHAHAVAAD